MRGARCCSSLAILLATISSASAQVMDAEFDAQWGLAAIGAQYALEKGITGAGVAVGVVDGIFQTTHPEFAGRIYPFEYNPQSLGPNDHGTHVAGIIGAGRNGFGMEGVAPDVSLAPIWAFAPDDDLAVAYRDAVAAGIKIFNNSWGLSNERDVTTQTRQDAISTIGVPLIESFYGTLQAGAVQVWAAGNAGLENPDLYAGLPYLFPELVPGWIVVTAVGRNSQSIGLNKCGVTASFCISAPGDNIYSTVPTSTYGTMTGTSMAAPHVTGAVALAKQMFPNAHGSELASLVLRTATDIGDPGIDATYGWGLLNVGNLVNVIDPDDDPEDGDDNGSVFVNAAFSRFAAVDTLTTTLWNRSAQRILDGGGATPTVSVAQATAASPALPAMALGGPPLRDDVDTAVMLTNGQGPAIWAQGLGAYARIDGSPRADASLGGVIGGYDLIDTGTFSAGIALAFTSTDLDTHGTGDDASAQGWHGFAYATWVDAGWFVDGVVGGNWFDNSYERTTIGGTQGTVLGNAGLAGASSSDTAGFAARVAGGQVYQWGGHALLPYAYLTVVSQRTGSSTETGADIFSLQVASSSLDQVEGGIGVRAQAGGIVWHAFNIAPSVDLAYGRLGGDVAFPVDFELLGSEFSANGAGIGRDVFRIGAQLDVLRFDDSVGGFLAYDGRFQQNAQNNTFSGGLFVRF
jgi:hypothetical protein